MTRDRSSLEVYFATLKYCQVPRLITHIMEKINLNHVETTKLIARLIFLNLLREMRKPLKYNRVSKRTWYETTDRGRSLIIQVKVTLKPFGGEFP